MPESLLHVVTGAFGHCGRYTATRLLDAGVRVRTITNSTSRRACSMRAFVFGGSPTRPSGRAHYSAGSTPTASISNSLTSSWTRAAELFNTYRVRFNTYRVRFNTYRVRFNTYRVRFNARDFQHSLTVENTRTLSRAAKDAGVGRVVHVGITKPSENSALDYFHGKAVLEPALVESGMSYAILRPTVLSGQADILINNIAWLLRRLPLFGVSGTGE